MAWSRTSPMDEKVRFIADSRTEFFSFSELCRRYGVSRKTGYKWLGRYEHERTIGARGTIAAAAQLPARHR